MVEQRAHQPRRQALAAVLGQDEDIGDPGERGVVGHRTGEAGLGPVGRVEPEAERVRERTLDDIARHPRRPVGLAQEPVDDVEVEPLAIRGDLVAVHIVSGASTPSRSSERAITRWAATDSAMRWDSSASGSTPTTWQSR